MPNAFIDVPVQVIACPKSQQEIIINPARNKMVATGRRWGKSKTATAALMCKAITKKKAICGYVAPTYSQCDAQFNDMRYDRAFKKYVRRLREDKPYPYTILHNSSRINFRQLKQYRNIRGDKYHLLIIDESQDVDEEVFREVLEPTVSDTLGTIMLLGQFRGHDWRYKDFYVPGIAAEILRWNLNKHEACKKAYVDVAEVDEAIADYGEDELIYRFAAWRYPTETGIMFQDEEHRRELELKKKKTASAIFDQEYGCIPTAKKNAVFRYEDVNRAIRGTVPPISGEKEYIITADLGRIVDRTGILVASVEPFMIVHSDLRQQKEKYTITARELESLSRRYNGAIVHIDATGGAEGGKVKSDALSIFRDQVSNLREFYFHRIKELTISNLSIALEQNRLIIPDVFKDLIDQLIAYEYIYRPNTDKYIYQGPGGHNDDLVSALAIMVQVWNRQIKMSGGAHLKSLI